MDISKVEILGNVYDEFNVEKYAALRPDVLLTNTWDGSYWYLPEASKDKILKLAPAAAIGVGSDASMDKALGRTADLAKSLGADLNSQKAVDAKARFEAAAAKVREATKANPGIKVLVGSGDPDHFYVSTPKTSADLKYFESLGVEFVVPDNLDKGSVFFESLSWENSRQVQGRRRPARQPHRHPAERAADEGEAHLGRPPRRQGLPGRPARDGADLLVREVRADPGRAREDHPERQEGRIDPRRPTAPHRDPWGTLRMTAATTDAAAADDTPAVAHFRFFTLEVLRTRRLGHSFLRVTFGGESLADFRSGGFDQSLSLFLPPPHREHTELPSTEEDTWFGAWRGMPDEERPVMRSYTVREQRRTEEGVDEVDIDFVLHGDASPASRWAGRAVTGRRIMAIGPAVAENKSVRFQPLLPPPTRS